MILTASRVLSFFHRDVGKIAKKYVAMIINNLPFFPSSIRFSEFSLVETFYFIVSFHFLRIIFHFIMLFH